MRYDAVGLYDMHRDYVHYPRQTSRQYDTISSKEGLI